MNAKQVIIGVASVAITAASFGISYAAVDAARGGDEPTALLPSGEPLEVVSPAPDTSASDGDSGDAGGSESSTGGGSSDSGGGGAGATRVEQHLEVVTASETPREGSSPTPSSTPPGDGGGGTDGLPFGADVPVLRFIDACASGQRSACPERFVPGTILAGDEPRLLGGARRLDEVAGPFDVYAAILDPLPGADRTFDLCRAQGVEPDPAGRPVLAVYTSHPARFTVAGAELPPVTAVAADGGTVTVVGPGADGETVTAVDSGSSAPAPENEIATFAFETQPAQARAWRDALATTGRPRWVVTCHRVGSPSDPPLVSNDRVRLEGFATPLPEMGTGGDAFRIETTVRGSGLVPGLIVTTLDAAGEILAEAPHRADQFVHIHAFGIDEEQGEALRAVDADAAFCSDSLGDDPSYGGRALPVRARATSAGIAVPAGTASVSDPSYTRIGSVRFEVPGDVDRIAVCGYWVQRDTAALLDRALVVASTPHHSVRLKVDVDPRAGRPEGDAPLRNLGLDFVAGPGSYWCRWDFRTTGPTQDICRVPVADQDVYEVVVHVNGTRERQQVPAPPCDGPRCRQTMFLLGDVGGEGVLEPVGSISLEKTSGVAAGWGVRATVRSSDGIEVDEELAPQLGENPWTSSVNEDGTLRFRVPWSASRPARVEAVIDATIPSCVMPAEAQTSYLSIEPAREGVAVFDGLCATDVYGITWTLVGRNGVRRTVDAGIDTT